jgi:hypothetical protein
VLLGIFGFFPPKKTRQMPGLLWDHFLLNYHQVLHNKHPAIDRQRRRRLWM